MAKLMYGLNPEDAPIWEEMRKNDDPVLIMIELDIQTVKTKIVKQFRRAEVGMEAIDKFKEMIHDPSEETGYQNKPAIVVLSYKTKDKRSQMEKTVLCVCKWIPEYCKMKLKMVYSSAWESLKKDFQSRGYNCQNMFEASDWDEVETKTGGM